MIGKGPSGIQFLAYTEGEIMVGTWFGVAYLFCLNLPTAFSQLGRGRSLPLWEALDLDLLGARDREPERAHEPCIKSKTSDVQGTKGSMLSEV